MFRLQLENLTCCEFVGLSVKRPIAVAARCMTSVCGRSLAGIVGCVCVCLSVCLSVSWECCVLSGRGFCVGLITRPEEFYRLWCVQYMWSRNPLRVAHEPESNWSATEKKLCTNLIHRKDQYNILLLLLCSFGFLLVRLTLNRLACQEIERCEPPYQTSWEILVSNCLTNW
jgi:hypothetical protein